MRKSNLIIYSLFCFCLLAWTSCSDSKESKPGNAKLSELTDKEILHIFKDEGINPDNINIENFRKYIVDHSEKVDAGIGYYFVTEDDLRKFLKEEQTKTKSTNERTNEFLDSIDKKKSK
ncbi:MAG: hypothetical protein ABJH05_11880 [Fulvivirga sp.]